MRHVASFSPQVPQDAAGRRSNGISPIMPWSNLHITPEIIDDNHLYYQSTHNPVSDDWHEMFGSWKYAVATDAKKWQKTHYVRIIS